VAGGEPAGGCAGSVRQSSTKDPGKPGPVDLQPKKMGQVRLAGSLYRRPTVTTAVLRNQPANPKKARENRPA
jgi:hypothetical protein